MLLPAAAPQQETTCWSIQGFKKLAFTGSTEVGYDIAAAAAKRLIPATLELGGKSANIYFPDCPWEKAIEGVQMGILFNQGQVCCAGSRVFVHEDIWDKFLAECVDAFNKVKGWPTLGKGYCNGLSSQ